MTCTQPRRGYTLVGILVIIVLSGLFLILFGELFVGTARLNKEAAALEAGSGEIASALHDLRAAVWSASEIAVVDPQTVRLDESIWHVGPPSDRDADRIAARLTVDGDAGRPLPVSFRLAEHPAGLLVIVDDHPTVLPGQRRLAEGGAP